MGYVTLLTPSHGGSDLGQNCFDHMRIVGNAQLVRDGQQQRVGLRDGLVLLELFDQGIRLGGVATAEDRARVRVDESDLVITVTCAPEISVIAIIDQCKNAATDRDARLAFVAGLPPRSQPCETVIMARPRAAPVRLRPSDKANYRFRFKPAETGRFCQTRLEIIEIAAPFQADDECSVSFTRRCGRR